MRVLLILGCIALGILLVAASHQDQAESGIQTKNEQIQGDSVNVREIRSTGENKKKKPKRPPGGFSSISNVKALEKRSIDKSPREQGKRRRCPGCYSPISALDPEKELHTLTLMLRQQRDTEEHEKGKKQHKHLKEKSKSKRRRSKNQREKHVNLQGEEPEIGQNNNKRRKHHRGKKDKRLHHPGMASSLGISPPDTEKMHKDISDMQDMAE